MNWLRLFVGLFASAAAVTCVAVAQNGRPNLASAVGEANRLVAVMQPDLPSYHVRYDVRIVHRLGQESTGSLDFIWGSPRSSRLEESADGIHRLSVEVGTKMWFKNDSDMSLRMMEFGYVRTRPSQEVDAVMAGGKLPSIDRTKIDGEEMECASAGTGPSLRQICFQDGTGLYASALLNGTRVTYDGWTPVGSRFIPTVIRLTRGKKLLLEARGTVQILQDFPTDAFQPPPDAVQVDVAKRDDHNVPLGEPRDQHRVVHREPMMLEANGVFGYVIVRVEVGTKGRVTKAEVVDSDDPALEHSALGESRGTIWEPYEVNGQLTAFEDELFYPFRAPLH